MPEDIIEVPLSAPVPALKKRCAHISKQIYEADPLLCAQYGGSTGIIAFIEQPEVIEKILTHLWLWPAQAHSPPESIAA